VEITELEGERKKGDTVFSSCSGTGESCAQDCADGRGERPPESTLLGRKKGKKVHLFQHEGGRGGPFGLFGIARLGQGEGGGRGRMRSALYEGKRSFQNNRGRAKDLYGT